MPHDFLEELNNEKEKLTSATENTEVNQLLAENLQKTIDKAKESSESFEILQRVVSSFNISGKNLSDNIGLIIDVFNRLNNAVKNNAEATSSLKQTHSSNIFGGTVRGAENLIEKLEEIANGIESVDNPFSGIFDKAISDGKEYLSIITALSQELKKISYQNIKLSASIKSPTRRGDEIVANLNENNNSSATNKKRRSYPKNFTRRRVFLDENNDDSVEYFFENFIKQNEDFRKISQLIEKNALLKNSFFDSLLTKLNSRGSKGPNEIIRTVTEHLQKNLYNVVELMISNLKNNVQDIDWKKERLDDVLSKQSTLNSDDIIQTVIHSFAVSDFDIEKLAKFSRSKKLSGDKLSQKINETFGENSVSLFERLMIGEKDDETKEAVAKKQQEKALKNSIGEIKLEDSDLSGISNKLFDEIVGSLTDNIVSEKGNKKVKEISSKYDETISSKKQRLQAYNENIDEISKILEGLYESDDGYSKEYMRIVNDRKTSLKNLNYRQEEREKIKTGEKSFEDSVFAFERKDANPSSSEEALEIADEIIEKNKKRLEYWDKIIESVQESELIYSDKVVKFRERLDKLVKNRDIVSKNIVGLENKKQQEIKKTKKEFYEDSVYDEAKPEGVQKSKRIQNQYDKLSPELKKGFVESLNKIISEIANRNNFSKKEALESSDFIESYSEKLLGFLKSIEDIGTKTINETQENLVKKGKGFSFSNVRLETIKKAGLEFEVGNIIKSKGSITEKDIIKILENFFKTDEGSTFVKENKINEDVILGKKRSKDDLTKYSMLLLNQTVELTNKFANLSRQINEFGVGWANLNKELARQTTSGSDLLAGQTTKDWGDRFNLTQKETAQLFPVIESFVRNSNVSLDTVNKIAENLKNSTGVLNPEDLKSALTAIQGMTQGQVNAMTGGAASMSDRYGAAFTLMENSSQLDAAIKAFSTGAFTGETPEGLSEGDKALLENNQNVLKTVDSIRSILSQAVSRWTPYVTMLGEFGSQIGGIAQMLGGAINMGMELIQTISAVNSLGGLSGLLDNSGLKGLLGKSGGVLGKIAGSLSSLKFLIAPLLKVLPGIAAAFVTYKLVDKYHVQKINQSEQSRVDRYNFAKSNEQIMIDLNKNQRDKNTKKGAAVGGTAGVLAGVAAGAAIGSVIPVLGTIIGGIIGGAVGAYAGSAYGSFDGSYKRRNMGFSEEEKKRWQGYQENNLTNLRSMKTYQTLSNQLKSGQFTKFEDAISKFSEKSMELVSKFGGSDYGFMSFSTQKSMFATDSFEKSMHTINHALNNLSNGLNANGKESINGASALASYTEVMNRQIEITEKFVSAIESSIGRYSEIPSIMLHEIKNKIAQFTFGINSIGGGTVSGGRQQINEIIKRSQNTTNSATNKFFQDIKNAEIAANAYKAQQQKELDFFNKSDGKQYTFDDLKNEDIRKQLFDQKNSADVQFRDVLKKSGFTVDNIEAIELHKNIADLNLNSFDLEKDKDKALSLINRTIDQIKSGVVQADDSTLSKLEKYRDRFNGKRDDLGDGKKTWERFQQVATENVFKKELARLNDSMANNEDFAKKVNNVQKKSMLLGRVLRINDGEQIAARNQAKILEDYGKTIIQSYQRDTQNIINASMNNADSSYYGKLSKIEEQRLSANKWSEQGVGGNISKMISSEFSAINSQVKGLEESKENVMKFNEEDFNNKISIYKKNAGFKSQEEEEFEQYAKLVKKRDRKRTEALNGDEKAQEEQLKYTKQLELMREKFEKNNISDKFKAAIQGIEGFSATQEDRISSITAKIEETRAQLIPNFLKSIEHFKNIETFTSKTYQAVAEANMKGMSYMSKMGASASEIRSSGNVALEASIKEGESSIKKTQNTYDELNTKEGKDKFIREQLEARMKKNGSISDKDRKEVEEMYKTQMATAGEAVINANIQAKQNNANVIREMEIASNLMSVQRQEGLNLEKALLNTVGAPIQEILKIERESIKETFNQYQNAQERYKTTLEEYKKGNVTQEELLVATNNMKKRQNEAYSQIIGAQRNVMEQMFGRLVGVFKGQAGFAGASMYSKYGAGLSVNAKGEVMALGSENKGANNSYGERNLGNQLSALGVGGVGGEKNDKIVGVIKDMAKLSGETLTTQVDRILEEMRKEKKKPEDKKENPVNNVVISKENQQPNPEQKPNNVVISKGRAWLAEMLGTIENEYSQLANDTNDPFGKKVNSIAATIFGKARHVIEDPEKLEHRKKLLTKVMSLPTLEAQTRFGKEEYFSMLNELAHYQLKDNRSFKQKLMGDRVFFSGELVNDSFQQVATNNEQEKHVNAFSSKIPVYAKSPYEEDSNTLKVNTEKLDRIQKLDGKIYEKVYEALLYKNGKANISSDFESTSFFDTTKKYSGVFAATPYNIETPNTTGMDFLKSFVWGLSTQKSPDPSYYDILKTKNRLDYLEQSEKQNNVEPISSPSSAMYNNSLNHEILGSLKSIYSNLNNMLFFNKNNSMKVVIEASSKLKEWLEIDFKNVVTKQNFRDVQQADVANRNK